MQTINVNMTPRASQTKILYCSQDDVGRTATINLLDETGAYEIPSGATVTIRATKPSGLGFEETCAVSGNVATVTFTETMTQEAGRFPAELRIVNGTTVIGTANFWLFCEKNPHPANSTDGTLETIPALEQRIEALEQGGETVPTNVRQAIFALFEAAAYAQTGLTDEIAVVESWAEEVTAITLNQTSISISGSNTVQLVATTTPSGKTVTWVSSDSTIATVSGTGLVTGVSNGTAVITASCGDLTATCETIVSGFATLVSISAVYTQSGTVYATTSLDDLKADLVVTGTYSDSSTSTLTGYTLSGTLAEGTSTITVSYSSLTTTFSVVVSPPAPLYQLYQGSGTSSSGNTLTVSGNNLSFATTSNSRTFYINQSSIGSGMVINSSIFSVSAGDAVEVRLKNIIFTSNTDAGNKFSVGMMNSDRSTSMFQSEDYAYTSMEAGTLEDISISSTFGSGGTIGSIKLYVYRGCVFSFDLQIYVNGTRYI